MLLPLSAGKEEGGEGLCIGGDTPGVNFVPPLLHQPGGQKTLQIAECYINTVDSLLSGGKREGGSGVLFPASLPSRDTAPLSPSRDCPTPARVQ